MWPFTKVDEEEARVPEYSECVSRGEAPTPAPVQEEEKTETKVPEYGAQAHGLTKFGKTWIRLDEVQVIEFDPSDGCGAEVLFRGDEDEWHITNEDAAAIKEYLEGIGKVR